jgi:hypothetical protein
MTGTIELTTHTFWESPEVIRAFAGDDITVSVVEPEAQAMLLDFDRTATHRSVVVDARFRLCGVLGGAGRGRVAADDLAVGSAGPGRAVG